MPPRLAKKTAVSKRRVSTRAASSPVVDVTPSPSAGEEAAAQNEEFGKSDPIMGVESAIEPEGVKEGDCFQPDSVVCARPDKRRAVVKKEGEEDGLDGAKGEEDVVGVNVGGEEEMVREREGGMVKEGEEEKLGKSGGEREIGGGNDKEEVQDDGEKNEKTETEELVKKGEIEHQQVEEGEPIEEETKGEMVEGGEPVEEEPVEGEEPVEEEPVEDEELVEEEPVEEEPMQQELVEGEPMEEEEEDGLDEEEDEEEGGEDEEEEGEGEEDKEEEEEPIEEELEMGDVKEEFTQEQNSEHKTDIVAVEAVQPASTDGGGDKEEQGLGDVPEPTMYMKALLPNRKVKETQIFISQLEKTVVEEDIAKVFARFGEVQSVRVVRHSVTQKSKGFAFLQYSTAEAVKKALSQLKDGTEIKGKMVHISASNQENCTIFVGNICKSWSKDQVLDALKNLGIEGIEQLALPEDPKVVGNIKGFAFVEFSTHVDAKAALNRLCKPDAVLGCDFSAKVSFAQFPVIHNEELLAKMKSVYLEPIPKSWDGKKIEEICKEYGHIEKIKLYRKSKKSKKKDFAFVDFVSRESALSCVEGLNKALDNHDDPKVSASIARPFARKTGTKFMMRGNFKVEKEEAKINHSRDEKAEKAEVKIIEVSGEAKRKRKKPKLKDVLTQKSRALSPQKTIKKNKKVNMKVPSSEMPKEGPQRHAPNKKPNKEAAVPMRPQGSKKRPFKEAPDSSRRPSKGKMKLEKGIRGGRHDHQSGTKKQRPIKGGKQRQRGGPAVNSERAFKRPRNGVHGDYHSHGSPIGRPLLAQYAHAPPPYTGIHVPLPYTSRAHEASRPEAHYKRRTHEASRYEPPYASRTHEPSRPEPPHISRTHESIRHEPHAYASGSYYSHRSDLAPYGGYIPPTHHAPSNRHVYETSAPAPYDGGYDRAIPYTREPPPVPPRSHPGYVTYPGYQQPSYPYPSGGSYPADYAPRSYY